MNNFGSLGKVFIIIGLVFLALGIVLTVFKQIPFLGKLPGDIIIKKDNFTLYFPVMSGIVISVILSLLFHFFSKGR